MNIIRFLYEESLLITVYLYENDLNDKWRCKCKSINGLLGYFSFFHYYLSLYYVKIIKTIWSWFLFYHPQCMPWNTCVLAFQANKSIYVYLYIYIYMLYVNHCTVSHSSSCLFRVRLVYVLKISAGYIDHV